MIDFPAAGQTTTDYEEFRGMEHVVAGEKVVKLASMTLPSPEASAS